MLKDGGWWACVRGNKGTGLEAIEEWEMETQISTLTEEGAGPKRSGQREIDPRLQSECNQILWLGLGSLLIHIIADGKLSALTSERRH